MRQRGEKAHRDKASTESSSTPSGKDPSEFSGEWQAKGAAPPSFAWLHYSVSCVRLLETERARKKNVMCIGQLDFCYTTFHGGHHENAKRRFPIRYKNNHLFFYVQPCLCSLTAQ